MCCVCAARVLCVSVCAVCVLCLPVCACVCLCVCAVCACVCLCGLLLPSPVLLWITQGPQSSIIVCQDFILYHFVPVSFYFVATETQHSTRLCVLSDKYHGLFYEVQEKCHDLVRLLSPQVGTDEATALAAAVEAAFALPGDEDSVISSGEKEAAPARSRTYIRGDTRVRSRGGRSEAGSQRGGQRGGRVLSSTRGQGRGTLSKNPNKRLRGQ